MSQTSRDSEPAFPPEETGAVRKRVQARGRSFLALVLSPEAPLQQWLADLDEQMRLSPDFFQGRTVILNLQNLDSGTPFLSQLPLFLRERGLYLAGVEGGHPDWPALQGAEWPPVLKGGRDTGEITPPTQYPEPPLQAPPPQGAPLIVDYPLRSGQEVHYPDGDVVILGGVSWGAEVVAGGSIHIYGPLRGRAIAGLDGRADARIFTYRFEAQLVAIDGYYAIQEELKPDLIGHPAQVRLDGETLKLLPLGQMEMALAASARTA